MLSLVVVFLFVGAVALGGPVPQTENPQVIEFKLFTRAHPDFPMHLAEDVCNLNTTDFNVNTTTVVIVHGFTESHDSTTVQAIRDAYLSLDVDLNVVVLNWWILSRGPHYDIAAENTKEAGRILANFLDNLVRETQGAARKDLHVVGFSLGAQVAGIAAGQLKTGKLPRITALDPAKPVFEIRDNEERLDVGDAEFVQVIHTASGFLSFQEPIGHADFYPNGGKAPQPPCHGEEALVCSHHMACMYFAESVYNPLSFPATLCDTWSNFKKGMCDGNTRVFMGAFAPTSAKGQFYLKTNFASPYGQGNSTKTIKDEILTCSNCDKEKMFAVNGVYGEDGPWKVSVLSMEPTVHVHDIHNSTASTVVENQLTVTKIMLVSGAVLLSLFVIVYLILRYTKIAIGSCRRTNTVK